MTAQRSIVSHFRMTEDDASRFLRLADNFPTVSHAALTLRAFQLGVAALETDLGLFATPTPKEQPPDALKPVV